MNGKRQPVHRINSILDHRLPTMQHVILPMLLPATAYSLPDNNGLQAGPGPEAQALCQTHQPAGAWGAGTGGLACNWQPGRMGCDCTAGIAMLHGAVAPAE